MVELNPEKIKPVIELDMGKIDQTIELQSEKITPPATALPKETTMLKQFVEGFVKEHTQFIGGAATLITKDPKYLALGTEAPTMSMTEIAQKIKTDFPEVKSAIEGAFPDEKFTIDKFKAIDTELTNIKGEYIPFGELTFPQQVANVGGHVVGFIGPAGVVNVIAKGALKLGLRAAVKEGTIRAAQTGITKYVGKTIARVVPEGTPIAKNIIGRYAGKAVLNAPSNAVTGAAYEAIMSGGDPERIMEGAIVFPVAGPALEVAAEDIIKVASYAPDLVRAGLRKIQQYSPFVGKNVDARKSAEAFEVVANATNNAASYADRTYKAAILNSKVSKLEAERVALNKQASNYFNKLTQENIKDIELGTKKIETIKPKTIDDLPVSFSAKLKLEREFGTIDKIHDIAKWEQIGYNHWLRYPKGGTPLEAPTYEGILVQAGLSEKQSAKVASLIRFGETKVIKLKPFESETLGKVKQKKSFFESQIESLNKKHEKKSEEISKLKNSTFYDHTVDSKNGAPQMKENLKQEFFAKEMEKLGVHPKDVKFPSTSKVWKQLERFNAIEEQTHIPVAQIQMDLSQGINRKTHLIKYIEDKGWRDGLKKLEALGVKGEDAHDLLYYVKKEHGMSPEWDPSAYQLGGYTITPYSGPEPGDAVKNILYGLRDTLYSAREEIVKVKPDIGFISRYVAAKKKFGITQDSLMIKGKVPPGKPKQQGLFKRRQLGKVTDENRALYETDLYKLYPRMINDSINAAAYSNVIDKANTAYWQLSALGHKGVANEFMKFTTRAMGYGNNKETAKLLSEYTVQNNPQWAKYFSDLADQHDIKFSDVHNLAMEMMYNSYIGLSKNAIIGQFIQPSIVGSAEVGQKNISKAYIQRMTKEGKTLIGQVKDRLYPEDFKYEDVGEYQRRWMKYLANIANLPGKPGMYAFKKMEPINREVTYLAAVNHFKSATSENKLEFILQDMLSSEQSRVMKHVIEGNTDKAMQEYGLIRANRINFAYNMADKPEFFAEGIGRYVPFLTWPLNTMTRHIEALGQFAKGNRAPIVKRIAYAYAGVLATQMLFNEKFYPSKFPLGYGTLEVSNLMPISAMALPFEPGSLSPTTLWSGVADARFISWVNFYHKVNAKKKNYGSPTTVIEFKKKKSKQQSNIP